jgi:hypothetical protein
LTKTRVQPFRVGRTKNRHGRIEPSALWGTEQNVFAAQVTSVPIALGMVVALAAFGALLPSMIKDSRRPPRRRAPKPVVIREPRPVHPARQIVLPVLGGLPTARIREEAPAPPPAAPPTANRRVTIAVASFVLLSLWSARAARGRATARR